MHFHCYAQVELDGRWVERDAGLQPRALPAVPDDAARVRRRAAGERWFSHGGRAPARDVRRPALRAGRGRAARGAPEPVRGAVAGARPARWWRRRHEDQGLRGHRALPRSSCSAAAASTASGSGTASRAARPSSRASASPAARPTRARVTWSRCWSRSPPTRGRCALARACAIKYVQLHAYQLPKVVAALRRPGLHLVKVLHVRGAALRRGAADRRLRARRRGHLPARRHVARRARRQHGRDAAARRRGAPRGSAHAAVLPRRRASPATAARPTATLLAHPGFRGIDVSTGARDADGPASARGGSTAIDEAWRGVARSLTRSRARASR